MRRKFGQIHKEYSPQARKFYCHFTEVTVSCSAAGTLTMTLRLTSLQNTKATSEVLVNSE